ncbi:hypothetical protein NLU13_2471 [Sarocladium strictum]|uniref:Malic acid transport protein n=1 Tax=Sarocladium strictum TaxID=5046 RepID=A0AA39L9J9_SARSR|nr:hypothetical protein NLU13_2471 [Sarocladium strictum]
MVADATGAAAPRRRMLARIDTPVTDHWQDGHLHNDHFKQGYSTHLSLWQRIEHITWAWFMMVMSTAGLSLLCHGTPHQFRGLRTIGKIFLILDLVFFVPLTTAMVVRFVRSPPALVKSLTHTTESLFAPCFFISISSLLCCFATYGGPATGPWFPETLWVLFWTYLSVTLVCTIAQFWLLFRGGNMPVHSMTPAWILPVFPPMLSGVVAANAASLMPAGRAFTMIIAGLSAEAMGFMVSIFVYPLYIGRLMQDGLPAPAMRPGMFVPVGPPGYMTVALIGMSRALPAEHGYFEKHPLAPEVLSILALWIGVWLWCLTFWFFSVAVVSVIASAIRRELRFSMSWWAFVFPNVGFVLATGMIGEELDSEGIQWVCSGMSILLVAVWFLVIVAQVRAVIRRRILWPGHDEDRQ